MAISFYEFLRGERACLCPTSKAMGFTPGELLGIAASDKGFNKRSNEYQVILAEGMLKIDRKGPVIVYAAHELDVVKAVIDIFDK